ncbi:putative mfs sugar transporter protein [Rosellinia necatrix]|uniref:Putative mfs sugar transporter protein n=1 Tax=Rosellinia necatrix TaxID=77044 RepID=A0A1W2TML7_ROSNE|nr:putative mfs sugar transporter protein [Rosellinia necatrix]
MYHLRRVAVAVAIFVFAVVILTVLPRVLNPVPPSKEKIEADQRWVNTSPSWFDRQACRWMGLCGLMHLKPDPPARFGSSREGACANDGGRRSTSHPIREDAEIQTHVQTKELGGIPQYVLDYAPLVHLYSEEHFWPSDIEDHIKHVLPHVDDMPLNQSEPLSLSRLNMLDNHPGFVTLKSKDNVECRPDWLHSTANTPLSFVDGLDDHDDAEAETPEGPWPVEDTTWFDVDKEHPLQRISDPRKVPGGGRHIQLPSKRPSTYLSREQRRIAARQTQNKPNDEGHSRAPATLVLVDKGSDVVDAFWFFFYAYNLGQTVLGTRYGNHVGDWEHAMIRFESGVPRAMYFSEHEGGQAYAWQAVEKRGNATQTQRPVIYSAVGSHAMYAMPGNHPYVLPFQMLKDVTDHGPLWDPSKNYRSYWYNYSAPEGEGLDPTRENPDAPIGWFHFNGRWGDKLYGLDDKRQWRLFGQYHYVTGPQGPKFKNLGRRKFLVGVFASVGSVLYGYDLGVIAGVIGSSSYEARFRANPAQNGAVVSLFTGGAFFGAGFAGLAGDRLGRRLTIMMGALIFILGGSLQTGAQTINFLYAGRALAGTGVGFLTMIIRYVGNVFVSMSVSKANTLDTVYQSEISHPSIRGRVTSLQQFMLGIGALVAGWTTYGCYTNLKDDAQWRVPLAIQIVPAVVLAALILLFPESPRWLIDHNRSDEGLATLARLHAGGDINDAWVRAEFAQIQESITDEHEHEAKSYVELFKNKSAFRRLFLACSIQASIQLTGVSAIQYFSVPIFGQIGISPENALKYQAINSVLALVAQFCCMLTIDKFGRRPVLISGNLVNCLTFVVVAVLLALFPPSSGSGGTAGWGFIVVTWIFNISFSYACGPLSWIIPAEIFDTHTRSKGVSIATMTSFAFNTLIGQVTEIAVKSVGWRYFLLFAIANLTNALFFYAILPETKLLPLEEMNYLFTHAPWVIARADPRKYRANLAADVERRAEEIREKGEL